MSGGMQTSIGKTRLLLVTGDIADQDTDAVVTAAHWRLNKGTGTDGTIHIKGGPRVYEELGASSDCSQRQLPGGGALCPGAGSSAAPADLATGTGQF